MALSPTESALLTETCQNMNIAANTCREVLEMLRSLGNTGVVDIATHNNATTAHASATNLAKYASNHGIYSGTLGSICPSVWSSVYPLEVKSAENGIPGVVILAETKGSTSYKMIQNRDFFALTDSSGDLVEFSDVPSMLNKTSTASVSSYAAAIVGLVSGERKTFFTGFTFDLGAPLHETDYKYTSIKFVCGNGAGSQNNTYIASNTCFTPYNGITASLGVSNVPFDTAYFRTAPTTTSDRREKSDVGAIGSEAVDFIKALRPVHFTVKNGKQTVLEADENGEPITIETTPGTRRHWGLIAQEVQEALSSAGYDPSECAVWSLSDKDNPDSKQALRYEELIAPMIKVIQQQQERIEALERKVA